MPATPASRRNQDPTPRLTLCLAMDLRGSTLSGLKLSTKRLDKFNLALVDQLTPHLAAVQLERSLVKFTGDGWLVVSDEQEDAAALCCLALIMARNFRHDMAQESGVAYENIPSMRLALCWGRDLPVTLLNGQRDFVGNSVRRAVRAMQFCHDNEILIDETVKTWVTHDFVSERVDMEGRLEAVPDAKFEEELVLHTLRELRQEAAEDPDAPLAYVNMLARIGRDEEAEALANRISDRMALAAGGVPDPGQLLQRWNHLLASNLDYETAREMLADLRRAGLRPDTATYNALIEKAQDYRSESRWLQTMVQEGIAPNTATFNALVRNARDVAQVEKRLAKMLESQVAPDATTLAYLIEKAPNYAVALDWTERMRALGVPLDAALYELLITRADGFETARLWLEEMMDRGIEPPETAFLEVFKHDFSHWRADDLLKWYLGLKHHPTHPIKRAIAEYRRRGMVDDALRLALDYPHTDTALKTIRQYPDRALEYFRSIVDAQPDHPNGAYALGMALVELGQMSEAHHWLQKAYDLASPGARKDELARSLAILASASAIAR